jgi:DNA repair exonuclease SbcCD ATPase subunit
LQANIEVAGRQSTKLDTELIQINLDVVTVCGKRGETSRHTQERAAVARVEHDSMELRISQRSVLKDQHTVASAGLAALGAQLQDVRDVKAQGASTRAAIAHLTSVRAVFHRNEAPRLVSYTYIEQMLGEVNRTLDLFEAPFRVEMDDNLGFICRFLDGVRVQPDSRLSVGERIVLAMAFRITVNSTFAGQVGVLILDEPTAGLDEHNLGCLPRALERLRDLSLERGLQVLFVTHEARISHLFDKTITL